MMAVVESNKLIRPVSISATTTTTPAMVEPEIESVGQEGLAKGNAKLWLDLQGKVRKDSFKNCLDLVTSQVLQYPGISLVLFSNTAFFDWERIENIGVEMPSMSYEGRIGSASILSNAKCGIEDGETTHSTRF